ncbi:hypothetical protein BLNAU_19933 [Blattamonas nauphoetae]|uniref:Uncharacterized protein n=1 Tax=Blattamonas nauphoetae TaxID=2049346 RepID=A0ABQ9X050_9EUKA|nr:hypothetical protein BLNAU_19933 [Blattamonas nauphoetae]
MSEAGLGVGIESLQSLDRTAHARTPTTLTQIIKLEDGPNWRTSISLLIDNGGWELKIRSSENTFSNGMLGFLRPPLPESATQHGCGFHDNGIGGALNL